MPIDWSPFVEWVGKHQRYVLMTHAKPDCDALGSEIGLAEVLRALGKEVRITILGPLQPRYHYLDPEREIETFHASMPGLDAIQAAIIVDTGTYNQIGEFGDFLRKSPIARCVIDHHRTQNDMGGLTLVDVEAEATGRLITEAADALGVALNARAANACFIALATDTGWFRHGNTRAETFALGERLIRAGAKPTDLHEGLFDQQSLPRLRLIGLVLERIRVTPNGRVAYADLFLKDFADTGTGPNETDDLINYPRSVSGTEVAVFFTELVGGQIRVSLRSRQSIDIGQIAEQFGGGGHRNAAGCTLPGPMASAQQQMLKALEPLFQ